MGRSGKASVWVGLGAVLLGVGAGVFIGEGDGSSTREDSATSAVSAGADGTAAVGAGVAGQAGAAAGSEAGAGSRGLLSSDQLRAAFERAQNSDQPVNIDLAAAAGIDLAAAQRALSSDPNVSASGAAGDVSYTNLSPFRDQRYYDPRDLAVIADLIAANGLTEGSSPNDADNGDGKLDPLEVGYQVWCGGRLREFRTGPNQFASFGYAIQNVPDSVAQLDLLEELDFSGNAIQQLPTSLADLQNLRALRLAGNQIQQFPTTVMTMANLQELVLRDNRIQAVPAAIGNMGNLRELHVDGNPLVSRPDQVMQQRISQGYDRGLLARQGAVVRTGGDCQRRG